MPTALGWVKYREHISLLVILCMCTLYVTKKKNNNNFKKLNFYKMFYRYPIMVKCLKTGKISVNRYISRSLVLSSIYGDFWEETWWRCTLGMCNSDRVLNYSAETTIFDHENDDRGVKKIMIGYSSTLGGTLSSDYFACMRSKYKHEKSEKLDFEVT